MGLFRRKATPEERAEEITDKSGNYDALLRAALGGSVVTKEMALQVPTVAGGIDLIGGIVAGTPIKLYRDEGGKAVEVRDDPRLRLLNDETGDTLNANEFWRAIVRDYYTGKGGYAYIRKERGQIAGLHYVDEAEVSIVKNDDPILKDFRILVRGGRYYPFQFLKILRGTKDGAKGTPITEENSKLIEVAYRTLILERDTARRGGRKKGFLESEKALTNEALDKLRTAFSRLYTTFGDGDGENFVVLNNGVKFNPAANTAAEMQLNETKVSNAEEFAKIFHVSPDAICGKGAKENIESIARLAAIPLMATIQCALNKDFLLEKEKGTLYWAFDTKELLKGSIKERFDAYKTALDANFMQIDEVRYAEDLPSLGLNWIRLGLNDVLYDPKKNLIYTPNTKEFAIMDGKSVGAGDNSKTKGGDTNAN